MFAKTVLSAKTIMCILCLLYRFLGIKATEDEFAP